jgi:hypothetical protein
MTDDPGLAAHPRRVLRGPAAISLSIWGCLFSVRAPAPPPPSAREPKMSPGLTQQLAPDQERRLRQQHKKRTAELGKAQKDGKEADLLSTLQAQAQRCEKAQREAANAEKVAAGGLAAIEAELGSARKKSSVLEALATDLHTRQKALLTKKHAQLAREDEHREQLAASFRDKIGAIQLKLEQIGEQRAVQSAESDRLLTHSSE